MNITKNTAIGFATPLSNTGSVIPFIPPTLNFTSRLDWLQGVVKLSRSWFDFVLNAIESTFKDTFASDAGRFFTGRLFEHHRISDRGGRVAWNCLDDDHYDVWLMLPAKLLSGAPYVYLVRDFLTLLNEKGFKPTRIDLAIDDYTKSLNWKQFDSAYDAGEAHGFRSCGLSTSKKNCSDNGFTFYMGSKGSDKLYRFYDKEKESDGEINAFRLEAQFRDDWCKSVWKCLLLAQSDSDFHKFIVDMVCSPIDFYHENSQGDKIYLDWWLDFKRLVRSNGSSISCGRVKSSISQSMEWIENQVERTLSTIEMFCERTTTDFYEWLNDRLESGRKKITSFHINSIESALTYLGVSHLTRDEQLAGFF